MANEIQKQALDLLMNADREASEAYKLLGDPDGNTETWLTWARNFLRLMIDNQEKIERIRSIERVIQEGPHTPMRFDILMREQSRLLENLGWQVVRHGPREPQ